MVGGGYIVPAPNGGAARKGEILSKRLSKDRVTGIAGGPRSLETKAAGQSHTPRKVATDGSKKMGRGMAEHGKGAEDAQGRAE